MISADVSSNALPLCESAIGSKTLHSSRGDWNRTLLCNGGEGKSWTLVGDAPFVEEGFDALPVFFMALLIYFGRNRSEEDAERYENFEVSVDNSEKMELLHADESDDIPYRFQLLLLLSGVFPPCDESSIL